MNTKRQKKLAIEFQTVVLYMLNRNPESGVWSLSIGTISLRLLRNC